MTDYFARRPRFSAEGTQFWATVVPQCARGLRRPNAGQSLALTPPGVLPFLFVSTGSAPELVLLKLTTPARRHSA